MLLIIGILVTLTAGLVIVRVWVTGNVATPQLGRMSEQWLAEYRASHPS